MTSYITDNITLSSILLQMEDLQQKIKAHNYTVEKKAESLSMFKVRRVRRNLRGRIFTMVSFYPHVTLM